MFEELIGKEVVVHRRGGRDGVVAGLKRKLVQVEGNFLKLQVDGKDYEIINAAGPTFVALTFS